jgi:hypothetical protein
VEHRGVAPLSEDTGDLFGDFREQRGHRRFLRHQRRHPPERGLLLRDARELDLRLGVGDRGADQLDELLQPRLGFRWERAAIQRRHDHRAPEPASDDDRAAERGARVQAARRVRDRAGSGEPEVVEPYRLAGPSDLRDDVAPAKRQPATVRHDLAEPAPARDDLGRVVLEADHARRSDLEQTSELLGDRVEDVRGRCAARDEGRHASQYGLFVGEPGELLARHTADDRGRDQLRDLDEPLLDTLGKRHTLGHRNADVSPHIPVDDGRRPGDRADAPPTTASTGSPVSIPSTSS